MTFVPLTEAVVVMPENAHPLIKTAAGELVEHLELMTGEALQVVQHLDDLEEGHFRFVLNTAPISQEQQTGSFLGYRVDHGEVLFHAQRSPANNHTNEDAETRQARHLLQAVYHFLNRECGIRWVAPDPRGTLAPSRDFLNVKTGWHRFNFDWDANFLDISTWDAEALSSVQQHVPAHFRVTEETMSQRYQRDLEWARRHCFQPFKNARANDELLSIPVDADTQAFRQIIATEHQAGGFLDARNLNATMPLPLLQSSSLYNRMLVLGDEAPIQLAAAMPSASRWLQIPATYAALQTVYRKPDSFAEALTEFSAMFGNAAPAVQQFFAFWHEHKQTKVQPALSQLTALGYGDWRRGLFLNLDDYFSISDFIQAQAFLHQALAVELNDGTRELVQELVLAHEHARLSFLAAAQLNRPDSTIEEFLAQLRHSRRLSYMRAGFRELLTACVPRLVMEERILGDVTGIDLLELFKDTDPYRQLPLIWRFRPDPGRIGEEKYWHRPKPADLQNWHSISLDRPWEYQRERDSEVADDLRGYDGVAWYAIVLDNLPGTEGRSSYLNIHGSSSSCRLYVNGTLTGEFDAASFPHTPASFRLPLAMALNRESGGENVIVLRVDDDGRDIGGIYRPVWLSISKTVAAVEEESPNVNESIEDE